MARPAKKSASRRDKLAAAVATARSDLYVAAPGTHPWPTVEHRMAFDAFSSALEALVTYHLSTPEWDVERQSWGWDYDRLEFYFEYGGTTRLARVDDTKSDVLQSKVTMAINPRVDVQMELVRLAADASRIRKHLERAERAAIVDRERGDAGDRS
jgi:hypothetical protein